MPRVATYNIHKGIGLDGQRHPDRILSILNDIEADVVALQEIDRRFGTRAAVLTAEAIAHHTDYVPVALAMRHASLGWHGNAILIRRGVGVTASDRIALPTIEPRGAVMAELVVNGAQLRVVAMHLDLSGLRRTLQARTIMAFCRSRPAMPTVIMGDTNEWSNRRGCLREFARGHHVLATPPSFHSRRPVARLDRIIVGPAITVSGCGTVHNARTRIASDHLPVWADIEIGG